MKCRWLDKPFPRDLTHPIWPSRTSVVVVVTDNMIFLQPSLVYMLLVFFIDEVPPGPEPHAWPAGPC